MQKLFFLLLLCSGLFFACTTSVELDPAVPTVSYSKDIAPIIAGNCAQRGCHGTENPRKFSLTSYGELSRLTTAGKPHGSELYNVIRTYGDGAMPPSPNNALTDNQIGLIYVWILQGANDN